MGVLFTAIPVDIKHDITKRCPTNKCSFFGKLVIDIVILVRKDMWGDPISVPVCVVFE